MNDATRDSPGSEASSATVGTVASVASDTTRPLPLWMNVMGWYGTLAIVGAYLATSHDWMEQGTLYQLLNVSGATGVGLVCWRQRAWQALTLEVVWVAVGLTALLL